MIHFSAPLVTPMAGIFLALLFLQEVVFDSHVLNGFKAAVCVGVRMLPHAELIPLEYTKLDSPCSCITATESNCAEGLCCTKTWGERTGTAGWVAGLFVTVNQDLLCTE